MNQPHNHVHSTNNAHDRFEHAINPNTANLRQRIANIFHLAAHDHDHGELIAESEFVENRAGIRTVWLALAALLLTSIFQIIITLASGSVALFADTTHNIVDGLNSIPLLIAFYLARRAATRRYTYGFHKAEDIAGILIVLSIAVSAGVVLWQSFQKLLNPQPLENLGWVAVAAIVGFLGNEAVAILQIRVGRRIGSAALVADGLHARTDALTSLAVLIAAAGSWLGMPTVDAIIGLFIGITILFITRDASRAVWQRLMDAVDPALITKAEAIISQQPTIKALRRFRMRWMGHRLSAEIHIAVAPNQTTIDSHAIAEQLRHALFHQIPNLAEVVVHIEPWSKDFGAAHQLTLHHEPLPEPITQ